MRVLKWSTLKGPDTLSYLFRQSMGSGARARNGAWCTQSKGLQEISCDLAPLLALSDVFDVYQTSELCLGRMFRGKTIDQQCSAGIILDVGGATQTLSLVSFL